MSAPRAKRQFAGDAAQRSITSYFGSSASSAQSSSNNVVPEYDDFRPQPPPSVQTNLLNVGMRVRKSVPEGYKTGKEMSGIGLFTNNAKAIPRAASTTATPAAASARTAPPPPPPTKAAELQPFCGIHKVGGLAPQAFNPLHDHNELVVPGLDEVPSLSRSQASAASDADDASTWGGRATRKRMISYDEDEEEGNRILFPQEAVEASGPVAAGRTIAIPRRRKADMMPADARSKDGRAAGDDFEDAAFLEPGAYDAK
jgi:hypothetical protein